MPQADARNVDLILGADDTRRLLDLGRPVAVLLLGVLHFVPDADDPAAIVARLRDAVCPGSHVALVNVTYEDQPPEVIEAQKLSGRTGTPILLRSRAELAAQFSGLELVDPGLVHLPQSRPDSPLDVDERPERLGALAGVGLKPGYPPHSAGGAAPDTRAGRRPRRGSVTTPRPGVVHACFAVVPPRGCPAAACRALPVRRRDADASADPAERCDHGRR